MKAVLFRIWVSRCP